VSGSLRCPACTASFDEGDWAGLAGHFVERADDSDASHVMWLNRRVTKHRTPPAELAGMLRTALGSGGTPPGDRVAR